MKTSRKLIISILSFLTLATYAYAESLGTLKAELSLFSSEAAEQLLPTETTTPGNT